MRSKISFFMFLLNCFEFLSRLTKVSFLQRKTVFPISDKGFSHDISENRRYKETGNIISKK
ncbi:hypothetical protein M114_3793 [Bacteroides fragilis str. 3986 N(B)22]|nr:hypothetical protein M114_3793 [Bacteroides fragilis str. 3986 N(B)22]